jgi:hypothetical protein
MPCWFGPPIPWFNIGEFGSETLMPAQNAVAGCMNSFTRLWLSQLPGLPWRRATSTQLIKAGAP